MSDPVTERLAAEERQRLKSTAQMLATTDLSELEGAMLVVADGSGIQTIPYVGPENDPREMSLWMLGAFLAHMDDSTAEDMHPLDIADHALALIDDYDDDERVGGSIQS